MPPFYFLGAVIVLTLAAVCGEFFRRRHQHRALRQLAVERRMHFSPRDQLRLTPRVAASLPIPGIASVRVIDLIYGSGEGQYRYVFTAEYTTGVVRSKKRVRRAATFTEPRQRAAAPACCTIRLASAELPLVEQYQELLK
jgi:hypothetical protein